MALIEPLALLEPATGSTPHCHPSMVFPDTADPLHCRSAALLACDGASCFSPQATKPATGGYDERIGIRSVGPMIAKEMI